MTEKLVHGASLEDEGSGAISQLGCEEDIYPLDEAIGLGSGEQMTLGVKERALWAAVEVSYEKAHQFLEKFTGLEVSRHKVHQMALEEGRRIEEWEEERRRQVFEQGQDLEGIGKKVPEVLYIQVDGTGVNDRGVGNGWNVRWGPVLASGYWFPRIGFV